MSELYLNLGRFAEARDFALEAVRLLGGMTLRVSMTDVSARSDAALAYLRLEKPEDARRYLAYTGAGRAAKGGFTRPTQFDPLPCGGDSGVKPADIAIVEVSVRSPGSHRSNSAGAIPRQLRRRSREPGWTPSNAPCSMRRR